MEELENKLYKPVYKQKIKISSIKLLENDFGIEHIEKLPKELFEISHFKSVCSILLSFLLIYFSFFLYFKFNTVILYPLLAISLSIGFNGLYVIGLNCINNSFFKSKTLNFFMAYSIMTLLMYPHNKNIYNKYKRVRNEQISKYLGNLFDWVDIVKLTKGIQFLLFAQWAIISIFSIGVQNSLFFYFIPWVLFQILVSTLKNLPIMKLDNDDESSTKKYLVIISFSRWIEYLLKDINLIPLVYMLEEKNIFIPHYNQRILYSYVKKLNFLNEFNFSFDELNEFIEFRIQSMNINNSKLNINVNELLKNQKKSRNLMGFLKSLNWLHVFLLIGIPMIGLYGILTVKLQLKTFIWCVCYYQMTMLGITAGYHRLFAHKSYTANPLVKFVLLMLGAGSVQGSARWWSRDHRAHHRYVDTPKDPYSANEGFFWSHFGWLMYKQDPSKIGRSNIDDLNSDYLVIWQHKNYIPIMAFMGFIFPTLVAGFGWNDWKGGYFYSGILRLVCVHHSTFFVNSLAHFLGTSPYSDKNTPRDSYITALLTCGEGYHNFHHEFPQDYRNGYMWYQYDPTKWTIKVLSLLGFTRNLKTFPENEIKKSLVQMQLKTINEAKDSIYWGLEKEDLPCINTQEFQYLVEKKNRKLTIIHDFVYDIETFICDHPGGEAYISMAIGKDSTKMFTGEVYDHSNAAKKLIMSI